MKWVTVESLEPTGGNEAQKILRLFNREHLHKAFERGIASLKEYSVFETQDHSVFAVELPVVTYMKKSTKMVYSLFEKSESDEER